jgi:hypothetical protein
MLGFAVRGVHFIKLQWTAATISPKTKRPRTLGAVLRLRVFLFTVTASVRCIHCPHFLEARILLRRN